ncbi:protein kinase [Mesobacillus foraminis]|uniref:serine/threonine protein kinase n=1 Tax=Mesobacillus foraminis TaxID=279826 RepID=UPI001BEC5E50|nr:protein kinase [Mesobacillus foraminis]MBT2757978.1 protein kinase [Mesobacillus foraminis]
MKWTRIIKSLYDRPIKKGVLLGDSYIIEKCLGMGGYGITYQCVLKDTQDRYVLKQLRPSKSKRTYERERFKQEVELLRKINHKRIPNLVDYFMIDGQSYYVMNKIDAPNLEDLLFLQKSEFTELESLILANKLLSILDYLHENLIFHSDIRPPNVLVKDGEVFLIDFGLAKKISPKDIDIESRRQDDFFDLGECLLFLLYSQFKGKPSKKRSWLEELSIGKETENIIKRLLGINEVYSTTDHIREDLVKAIDCQGGLCKRLMVTEK